LIEWALAALPHHRPSGAGLPSGPAL